MQIPSYEEACGLSNPELAALVLQHLKEVTLPRSRGNIPRIIMAKDMIAGLEAWIAEPEEMRRIGKEAELREDCLMYYRQRMAQPKT